MDSHDPVLEALRHLPTVRPQEGFSQRVLRALDAPPVSRSLGPRPMVLRWAAAAAVAVLLVVGSWSIRHHHEVAQRQHLRRESRALAAELAALRRDVRQQSPIVYLGGTEDVDVVLDLSRVSLAGTSGQGSPGTTVPAVLHSEP